MWCSFDKLCRLNPGAFNQEKNFNYADSAFKEYFAKLDLNSNEVNNDEINLSMEQSNKKKKIECIFNSLNVSRF
jgi:hypothetical protein